MTRGLRFTQAELDRINRRSAGVVQSRMTEHQALQHRLDFGETKRKPRPVKIRAPVPTEARVQMAFVHWTRLGTVRREWPELAFGFHCPNGEVRDKRTAAKLLALGVLPGVADWILLAPRGRYHGLMIEFKRPGEKVRPGSEQEAWLAYHRAKGYCALVMDDWERARVAVLAYLRGELGA